jgi:hypothetical protein
MFLFQLLRYFHGPYEIVGAFVLPTVFFLVLFFWPFLDRGPQRAPRRRPVAMGLLGLGTVGLIDQGRCAGCFERLRGNRRFPPTSRAMPFKETLKRISEGIELRGSAPAGPWAGRVAR